MLMQLNRKHVHVSSNGLSFAFEPGVPVHVPPKIVKEIIAIGGEALPEDKEQAEAIMQKVYEEKAVTEASEPKIEAAIRVMLGRNQRGDFTAGNRPNRKTLYAMTGVDISQEDLEPIWLRVREEVRS